MKRAILFFYLLYLSILLQGQAFKETQLILDSLKKVTESGAHDTIVLKAYAKWENLVYADNPKLGADLSKKMLTTSMHGLKKKNQPQVDKYLKKSMAYAYNNLGLHAYNKAEYIEASDYFHKSLKLYEGSGNKQGVGNALNNIGLIYDDQKDFHKALEYYKKSFEVRKESNLNSAMGQSLNNIANAYDLLGESDTAIAYYNKSLELAIKHKDIDAEAHSLNNIGVFYYYKENYNQAIDYFKQSLQLLEKQGMSHDVTISLNNIGAIYAKAGDINKAIEYAQQSLMLSKKIGAKFQLGSAANSLYKYYKQTGQAKLALNMYENYVQIRDTIQSEENQKEVIRHQYKYEYEKQAAADSVKAAEASKVKDAQLTAQRAENARQQQQAYFLYGGLALALLFGGFIFNRFRVTNKQKKVIEVQKVEVEKQREFADSQRQLAEEQKEVVEEKNKEIIDSINYAKRLQDAILPPAKLVKEYLQQSFILYKPKDIVAGDFYWMETLPGRQAGVDDTVYFAAADCTGHGVPGAMVSVVCSNALSKALVEENITDVGQLLDRTRELVVERFGRSEENIQDGMDIALCALNAKTNELQYAGANNPLWVIRKGATEVEETKADKQPIGKYDAKKPFTTQTTKLNQGDTIYIFSDGYPDQFGGDKGKKYKTGAMKRYLLSIQNKDMANQHKLLNQEFESWKGDLEQIDDVCVIGVKV